MKFKIRKNNTYARDHPTSIHPLKIFSKTRLNKRTLMEGITFSASHDRQLKPTSRFRFPIDTRKSNESPSRVNVRFFPFWTSSNPTKRTLRETTRLTSLVAARYSSCHLSLENNRPSSHASHAGKRERRWKKDGQGRGVQRVMELEERSQREGRNYVIAVSLRSGNSIT